MDDSLIVAFVGLGLLCILIPLALIVGSRDKKQANKIFDSLNYNISDTYLKVFGKNSGTPSQQLNALWEFAKNNVEGLLQNYWVENDITHAEATYSNLGMCGISDTHFFTLMDKLKSSEYDTLMNVGNLINKYNEFLSYEQRSVHGSTWIPEKTELRNYIVRYLPLYVKLKQTGVEYDPITIPLDEILYYKIEGNVHHLSNVSGGGVNLQGAVAGAIIGGGAAAIIGSRIGTETTTEFVTQDDRKVTLYVKRDGKLETIPLSSTNVEKTIEALRNLIPDKEESVVQMETYAMANTNASISSADELKKFKELLDMGVISQEEFDAKKNQLLGL